MCVVDTQGKREKRVLEETDEGTTEGTARSEEQELLHGRACTPPRGTAAQGDHMLEHGKSERKKEQQRGTTMY